MEIDEIATAEAIEAGMDTIKELIHALQLCRDRLLTFDGWSRATETADNALHDSTTQDYPKEIRDYWKEKEGRCLGCHSEIALEETYCPSCTEFLVSVYEESREQN